jgi:hypothetical protein
MPTYVIRRAAGVPKLKADWNDPMWKVAPTVKVAKFHPQSSDHHPVTRAKVLYDDRGLYVSFKVEDRYVRAVSLKRQSGVCRDSCVEFFVAPKPERGYFNFEINCGGTMLLYYIPDSPFIDGRFVKYMPVADFLMNRIRIYHSMPRRVAPEIKKPVAWELGYFIPFSLFEKYVGRLRVAPGRTWRANFYKCAGRTSHPHWASWAPIGPKLCFHLPERFGALRFGK